MNHAPLHPAGPPLRPLELLSVLNEHDVDFVVIGGFALGVHGAPRATKDIDMVPDPTPANLDRLWRALEALGAEPMPVPDFAAAELPLDWERACLDHGGNWIITTCLGRLDILQYVAGVDGFAQLRAGAVASVTESAGRIWFAGHDDLIAMKRAAGRPQDLLDIESLERGGDGPLTGF